MRKGVIVWLNGDAEGVQKFLGWLAGHNLVESVFEPVQEDEAAEDEQPVRLEA